MEEEEAAAALVVLLLLVIPPLLDARTASSYDGRVAYHGIQSKGNKNKKTNKRNEFEMTAKTTKKQQQQAIENKMIIFESATFFSYIIIAKATN